MKLKEVKRVLKKFNWKKALTCVMASSICFCTACGSTPEEKMQAQRGLDDYAFSKASYAAVDRENRAITTMHKEKTDHERYVGVFYFLWLGSHVTSAGVYNVTELEKTQEGQEALMDVTLGLDDYLSNGLQSPANYVHWTNEPLYGYYNSSDPWVISRHIELLTMADVDFVFFDTTNERIYEVNEHTSPLAKEITGPSVAFLDTLLEYQQQGWDVPQVVFYTNNTSGDRVREIYETFYLQEKYQPLWFSPFGKPMIIGTTANNNGASDMSGNLFVPIDEDLCEYFDVRESQWPSRPSKDWGIPWMDWTQGDNYYFADNKVVNVSVAQHGHNECSYSIKDGECSRGWNEEDYYVEENWAAGRNIEDQWETVFKYESQGKDVEMVTVSCWNEWLAWKACFAGANKPVYVDNFSAEYSRDIEMDREYYQDNFYLQLVRNVREYKYSDATAEGYAWLKGTMSSMSSFDSSSVVKYKDMVGEARERDFWGFDIRVGSKEQNLLGSWYVDKSNRNDIAEAAVTHDDNNLYLRITTKDDITEYAGGENWMNILIDRKSANGESFEGYEYLINRAPSGGKASVDLSIGGWNWNTIGYADMQIVGNQMMITIPLNMLGMSASDVRMEFKVADNVTNYTDIMDYYVTGDSAPIGRLKFAYGY